MSVDVGCISVGRYNGTALVQKRTSREWFLGLGLELELELGLGC